ncbi:MAG TPA: hypothetical protein VFC69_10715 [Dysgonamonadaceae bacterium]|nr:hypothetical protein [Dysgonamonadaceae bacterium]
MKQQLLYEIAQHRMLINTPDAEVTERLIPSFRPFRVDDGKSIDLLLQLSGSKQIFIPDRAPDDVMEADGMSFEVYHHAGSVTVSVAVGNKKHSFNISADKKRVATDLTLLEPYESRFLAYFLRAAYGIAAANYQTIKLHASVIEKEGKALVFMGKSGTGKSTHSQNWLKFVPDCQLLNDDEPILRILKDGSVRVYGAPWSGSTPCYRNDWAEVAAFVRLYQSPENKLTSLKGIHAFASLYQSVAILRSDDANKDQIITIVNNILEQVPIYRLDNRPDREAVSLTETLLK